MEGGNISLFSRQDMDLSTHHPQWVDAGSVSGTIDTATANATLTLHQPTLHPYGLNVSPDR